MRLLPLPLLLLRGRPVAPAVLVLEFTPQQARRIVRDSVQPLISGHFRLVQGLVLAVIHKGLGNPLLSRVLVLGLGLLCRLFRGLPLLL